jgi:predicted DsbA family dithiol-disulfide isomerase
VRRIELIVYSDFLCPWCYNAAVRLRRLAAEADGAVELEWRSYLLRPHPVPRDLERFRAYTQSWLRPAAEPDSGTFRVWEGAAGPPSHSVPPHLVAKAAARCGRAAGERMHARLLHAYFAENRDITDAATLRALWAELDLPADGFAAAADPALLREVVDQHNEALELGIGGVPAVRPAGGDGALIGAQSLDAYRHWVRRLAALADA